VATHEAQQSLLASLLRFQQDPLSDGLMFFRDTPQDIMIKRVQLMECCFSSGVPAGVSKL
jgi:hypothetical protein